MVSQARLHNELEQESQDITQNQHLPAVFRYRHNNISVMGPTENIFERRQTVRWLPPRARPREQTTNNTAERHEGVVAAAANGRDIWEEIERMTMVQREQQERIDRLETENAQLRGRVADVELVNGQLQHRAANTDAETAHLRHLVLLLEENIDQLEYQVAETDYTGLHCRIARLEDIEARGDQEHDDEFWPYDDFSEDWDEDDAGDTRVQDELHDLEDQAADTEYLYEDLPMWAGPYDDGAWDGPYDDDLWHEPVSSDEYESEEVRPRGPNPYRGRCIRCLGYRHHWYDCEEGCAHCGGAAYVHYLAPCPQNPDIWSLWGGGNTVREAMESAEMAERALRRRLL